MTTTSITGEDAIIRAVRTASDRARRLGETVPLSREGETVVHEDARMQQGALAACFAGLSLWAVVLFLLGQN